MTISLAERQFHGPFLLKEWSGSEIAAVYTLLVLDGAEYRPRIPLQRNLEPLLDGERAELGYDR